MRFLLALLAACSSPAPVETLQAPPPTATLDLAVTGVVPGSPLTWTVRGLNPGETVYLLRSSALSAHGPCPPVAGGLCLDVRGPVYVLGQATANARGVASRTLAVPAALPAGGTVALQAVAVRGLGGVDSTKSPALARTLGVQLGAPASTLGAEDLVITEIFKDPTTVADAVGEWFEVENRAGVDVDLLGLEVADRGAERFVVDGAFVLAAGDRAVFGPESDPLINGGVSIDVETFGLVLGNGADALVLSAGHGVIDAVDWDATFPSTPGASLSLDPGAPDNHVGSAWCDGSPPTPGLPNEACPACGDGTRDPGEACDDGNTADGDGCDATCAIEPFCGDGLLDPSEGCDDGNNSPNDGCDAACAIEPFCGDGALDPGEDCDDGNNTPSDGCDAACAIEPFCGDGLLDPGEDCDDGNNTPNDGCDATCLWEGCPVDELPRGRTSFYAPGYDARDAQRYANHDLLLSSPSALFRVGADLAPQWSRRVSDTYLDGNVGAAAPRPDGGAWLVGLHHPTGYTSYDSLLAVQLDATGAVVGTRRLNYNGAYWEYVFDVVATPDNGAVIVGKRRQDADSFSDAMVLKLNSSGDAVWTHFVTHNVNNGAYFSYVRALPDGSVVAIGQSGRDFAEDGVLVYRFNPNGGVMYSGELLYASGLTWIRSVTPLANGDLALVGGQGPSGSPTAFVQVISPTGARRWTKSLKAAGWSDPQAVVQVPATCDTAVTSGQACSTAGLVCANATANVCDCDGAAWTCSAQQAELHVAWTALADAHPWRLSQLSLAGAVVETWQSNSAGMPPMIGDGWTDAHGGTQLAGAAVAGSSFEVARTDLDLDWGCGRTRSTDVTSPAYTPNWQVLPGNGGSAALMDWRTTSDYTATSTVIGPLFPTVLCADTVCP